MYIKSIGTGGTKRTLHLTEFLGSLKASVSLCYADIDF